MTAAYRSLTLAASLAFLSLSGCAANAEVASYDEAPQGEAEDGLADQAASNRSLVLTAMRSRITQDYLHGAAFLRRGESLVLKVNKFVERGEYALFSGTAMRRRRASNGRVVDSYLSEADLEGSELSNADFPTDGYDVLTLLKRSGNTYVPVKHSFESGYSYDLFQFASTDTIIIELACSAIPLGFTHREIGVSTSLECGPAPF